MSIDLKQIHLFADLGDRWLRDHTARIEQRHLQFGMHLRLDASSLLSRAASLYRGEIPRQQSRENFIRRATIDAVEHCLRLDVVRSTPALEPNVA